MTYNDKNHGYISAIEKQLALAWDNAVEHLGLTEQDSITGITTRKRKTLMKVSWMISWREKQMHKNAKS